MLLYIVINWNLLFHDTMCTYYVGYDGLYFTILLHLKNQINKPTYLTGGRRIIRDAYGVQGKPQVYKGYLQFLFKDLKKKKRSSQ